MDQAKSETRDGMRIDWDVPIAMDDGLVLRADVFRPVGRGPLSGDPHLRPLRQGPRLPGGLSERMGEHGRTKHPDVAAGSTNKYQNWEVVDPEKWVPDGYVCVRVDSRGAGRSPGFIDHFSPRETRDFYDCIEWAGVQPWCNGKVGLNGISYYGINQWQVAALQPPHLAAMCVWEGAADWYRDMTHHGGILSTFWANWYDMQVKTVQHGLGERGPRSRVTGELVCGAGDADATTELAAQPLRLRRRDPRPSARRRLPQARSPDLVEGDGAAALRRQLGRPGPASARQFRGLPARRVASRNGSRCTASSTGPHFYTDYGVAAAEAVLRPFPQGRGHRLGHAAARAAAGAPCRPVRRAARERMAAGAHAMDASFYLDPQALDARPTPPAKTGKHAQLRCAGRRRHLHLAAARARDRDHRTIGGQALRLLIDRAMPISSSCCASSLPTARRSRSRARSIRTRRSARAGCAPRTASSTGAVDALSALPHAMTSVSRWRRASRSTLDIEIWPTSIVVPAGYRIALTVRGKDYEHAGPAVAAFQHEERVQGLRSLPAQRSARPPAGDLRRPDHAAYRTGTASLYAVADHSDARERTIAGSDHMGARGRDGGGARKRRSNAAAARQDVPNGKSSKRLTAADREQQILAEAVRFFAEVGFNGHTRELAQRLHITQPLLYRYFPTKQDLIERVFKEVFFTRVDPEWAKLISDRSRPLEERLIEFYQHYAARLTATNGSASTCFRR